MWLVLHAGLISCSICCADIVSVGTFVSTVVGTFVTAVGVVVGGAVGTVVGTAVGATVGMAVGTAVGAVVGCGGDGDGSDVDDVKGFRCH